MKWLKALCSTTTTLVALTQFGCGRPDAGPESKEAPPSIAARQDLDSTPILNTLIKKAIEIDHLGTNPSADANLFLGDDPADGTASAHMPAGGDLPFIDWDDLGSDLANHRLLDLPSSPRGKDSNSFPRSNECVGASNVLGKMELTYIAAANNGAWAYLAVQRAENSGDAGYYWLFTRRAPRLIEGQAPCNAGESRLLYDINAGDVLIAGHFHPDGTSPNVTPSKSVPLLTLYSAKKNLEGVTAIDVLDFTNPELWEVNPSGVGAVAVNTTPTRAGAFGSAGVTAVKGWDVQPEIFAESAVSLDAFAGGDNCGAFYGSVITRASGSGGTSPDLKDLAGPAIFNFGEASATATLKPTCGLEVEYQANGFRPDGQLMEEPQCVWKFDDGKTVSGCVGVKELTAGSHKATVTVTDAAAPSCHATVANAEVTVLPPLTASADLLGSCQGTFSYSASASGGSGEYDSYQWSFGEGVSPSSSTSSSGTATVAQGGATYLGRVVVTDTHRPDKLKCTATAEDRATVYMPTRGTALLQASCTRRVDYGVASTSGVAGTPIQNPICEWTFDEGPPASGCSGFREFRASVGGTFHTATVKVTDPAVFTDDPYAPDPSEPGCSDTVTGTVVVYPEMGVAADLVGSCLSTFAYSAMPSGGSGSYSYQWTFGDGVISSTLTERSGTATVAQGGISYTGTVVATDRGRSDSLICTASGSDSAVVYKP
ncbi:MAG TPA: hypothetical protein VE782_09235, partial [Myxococcaceae bacterium]|nr:hypothetical protein [Myxococcaceae bacterium]